jgi:hypothetical protein
MAHIYVRSEKVINANPSDVYTVISDYKEKRPGILTPNFIDYRVEKGGQGDGTVVSYRLRAARRERPYHIQVKEPIKGQVLTENDTNSSLVTTWSLTPLDSGQRTMVRVATEWEGGRGIKGFFERIFAPLGVRRIYNRMLERLASSVPTTATDADRWRNPAFLYRKKHVGSNIGLLFFLFGAVIALGLGIRNLLKRR